MQIKINEAYKQLFDIKTRTLRKDVRYFEEYGGRRSAKSHDTVQVLGLTALLELGHFIPCIRKVATTLKDSVLAEVKGFLNKHEIKYTENKTDKEITLSNNCRFRGFGLDDPEKLKSLKGATIIWFEEANEITEEEFDSIDAGLSPANYPGRIMLTHNPVPQIKGSLHWIQKRFLQVEHQLSKAVIDDTPTGKALVLRTWYKDNAFCPPETIKLLEGYKKTNPEKYKLWALGEFTKLEGCVFDNWDTVAGVPEGIECLGVGLDFGYSVDPAAAVRVWAHKDEIWVKGLVYKTGLSNLNLYNEMKLAGVDDRELITCDSAEPKSRDDLRDYGFQGIRKVNKKPNYKEDLVNRIRSFKLHLVEGDTDLQREFSTYSWSRDKNNKQLPKLQDGDDHYIDAFIMRMHDYYQHRDYKLSDINSSDFGF